MVVREKLGNGDVDVFYFHTSATPLPVEDGRRVLVMVEDGGFRELKKFYNAEDSGVKEVPKKLVKDVL